MNYLTFGPIRLRISRRGLAPWGYARLEIGGLSLLSRDSGGGLMLASYHPRRSKTWHWVVSIKKRDGGTHRSKLRYGQWHDYYALPFGRQLIVGQQDYHKPIEKRRVRPS